MLLYLGHQLAECHIARFFSLVQVYKCMHNLKLVYNIQYYIEFRFPTGDKRGQRPHIKTMGKIFNWKI